MCRIKTVFSLRTSHKSSSRGGSPPAAPKSQSKRIIRFVNKRRWRNMHVEEDATHAIIPYSSSLIDYTGVMSSLTRPAEEEGVVVVVNHSDDA